MLNHSNSFARKIEELPISFVNRDIARAHFTASEANFERIARALARVISILTSMGVVRKALPAMAVRS